MSPKEKTNAKIIEIGELRTITNSQILRRILQKSRAFHQEKVNEHIRAKNLIGAAIALGKVDYIDKLGNIVQAEYDKLIKEAE